MKKQEIILDVNYNRLPKRLRGKARQVAIAYTDQSKLSAVARWKERMARAGIRGYDLARHIGEISGADFRLDVLCKRANGRKLSAR